MRSLTLGPVSQKVLLLLVTGLVLGLSGSPRRYFRVLKDFKKDWREIESRSLHRIVKKFSENKLVEVIDNADGSSTVKISEKGKRLALRYQIDEMKIPIMKKWDGKWRIILFDIPERHGRARRALQHLLKTMGFYQFQKSVFIHPFECSDEITFVTNFFGVQPYVRSIVAQSIDNEAIIKKHYDL